MFTEQALLKAKIDLYNIISNHAYQDYYNVNFHPNGKRKSKSIYHIHYRLIQKQQKKYIIWYMVRVQKK